MITQVFKYLLWIGCDHCLVLLLAKKFQIEASTKKMYFVREGLCQVKVNVKQILSYMFSFAISPIKQSIIN